MSASDGKPEIAFPTGTQIAAGTPFYVTATLYRFDSTVGRHMKDNAGPVTAFIAAVDRHIYVPAYNPLPMICTPKGQLGAWTFRVEAAAIRPGLLRAIFHSGRAYLTVLQDNGPRTVIELTVAR